MLSWEAWLGVYLGVGVIFGLFITLFDAAIGQRLDLRPDCLIITALFWPFMVFLTIWIWISALWRQISLDEVTGGQVYLEIEGWFARHPDATPEVRRSAVRRIVQEHRLG
jgi:hypothetical protein